MRLAFGVLVVSAWLAACETRYGSYLIVDGAPNNITFDRVELFFGYGNAGLIPQTPLSPATDGRRFTRQFTASDVLALETPHQSVDFYLPEGSKQVGKYVAVVAFKGDTPVGVGELLGYEIPSGTIYQYVIELSPWSSAVEHWGDPSGPACLRWTRERDGAPLTFAVVRDNDSDCDGVVRDCQDLAFCTAADLTCNLTEGPCFVADTGCMIGRCVDGEGCVPESCTIPGVCSTTCEAFTDLTERLACAVDEVLLEHIAVKVPVDLVGQLCPATTLKFLPPTPGISCQEPSLDVPVGGVFPDVKFTITADPSVPPGAGTATPCLLQLESLANVVFGGDHHLLISIAAVDDPINPPPVPVWRWSFVIGVEPGLAGNCDGNTNVQVEGMGSVMTCRP